MEPRRGGAALRYAYTEITPRQHADDLPTGDYRQVPATAFLGETQHFFRRVVSRDRVYVSGHHVAEYRSIRVLSSGEDSADSVSLGKNTYQHVPGVDRRVPIHLEAGRYILDAGRRRLLLSGETRTRARNPPVLA